VYFFVRFLFGFCCVVMCCVVLCCVVLCCVVCCCVGPLPAVIGKCVNLRQLSIADNELSGG
jgi:hypothetical protein